MKRRVRTHTFNGRKYHIYLGPLKGTTSPPGKARREIMIRTSNLSERTILDTIIHESLHASDWPATEKKVNQVATDISRLLWRLDYRREKPARR